MPNLKIQCENIRNAQGQLVAVAWSSTETFRSDKKRDAVAFVVVDVTGKTQLVDLGELPAGTYAVAVLHDENRNEKLDVSRMLGLPIEGIAYSNNPRMGLKGPSWDTTSFEFGGDVTLDVRMKYWL